MYAFDIACHNIVHVILIKLEQRKNLLELGVNMSQKSTGNLFGCIRRHPVYPAEPVNCGKVTKVCQLVMLVLFWFLVF